MARWLRDLMTIPSRARYLAWRALGVPPMVTVKLVSGERLVIRREPAGDFGVAYEIFVLELYRAPHPLDVQSVRRIVDVGANVGYSLSYLARRYPAAHIDAFEPHPDHCVQIARNLKVNRLEPRITLHPVAAGVRPGSAWLVDDGTASYVATNCGQGRIPIAVADFFEVVGGAPIDLLKMDCEGGEYDILMSSRFEQLDVRVLTLEWHATQERPFADREIGERLESLGLSLERGPENQMPGIRSGMLWGYR